MISNFHFWSKWVYKWRLLQYPIKLGKVYQGYDREALCCVLKLMRLNQLIRSTCFRKICLTTKTFSSLNPQWKCCGLHNYDGGFKYPETFKFRLIFINFTCMGPHVSLQWFLSGEHSVANLTTNATVRHWAMVYQRIHNIRPGSSTPHIGVLIFTIPVRRVPLRWSPVETCGWGAVRHRSVPFTIPRNHTNSTPKQSW